MNPAHNSYLIHKRTKAGRAVTRARGDFAADQKTNFPILNKN